jgi:hypothetical protein
MLKTKELDEPSYGPAATYERLSNVVKKQISIVSVPTNVEVLSSYLDQSLSELRRKTFIVAHSNEMWNVEERNRRISNLQADLESDVSTDLKKLRMAAFISRYGGENLELIKRFHTKVNDLGKAQLLEVGEKVVLTVRDDETRIYFEEQLHEPSIRTQTLRRLIRTYCSDTKLMKDVVYSSTL